MPDKEDKSNKEEPKAYTSVSFLRMLGIALPSDGKTVEEVVEAMKQHGAQPWQPEDEATAPTDTEEDA